MCNVKAVVAAFNQEKALVGAFSVITNLRMEHFKHYCSPVVLLLLGAESPDVLVTLVPAHGGAAVVMVTGLGPAWVYISEDSSAHTLLVAIFLHKMKQNPI